ncbi:MAG: AzlC family ABC transporter permease [Nocardioidaceae bacterium]
MTTTTDAYTGADVLAPPHERAWRDVRRGALEMLPLLVGYAPFACLVGVAVAGSSAPAAAWAGVLLIFAGSAHLMTIQLVDAGGGVLVVALSALAVNARLLMFSATLAPAWRGTRLWVRLAAAVTVIDPSWMLSSRMQAIGVPPAVVRRHYAGASVTLLLGWSGFVAVGAVMGNLLPAQAGLSLFAPLCLLAMVAPGTRTLAGAACAAVGLVAALAGGTLPAGLPLLVAMPLGVVTAGLCEAVAERRDGARS